MHEWNFRHRLVRYYWYSMKCKSTPSWEPSAVSASVLCKWLLDTLSQSVYGCTVHSHWSRSSLRMAFRVSSCQPCQSCSVLIRFSSCLKASVPFDKTKELTPKSCGAQLLSAIGVAAVYTWVKQLVGWESAKNLIMSFNSSISIKTRN